MQLDYKQKYNGQYILSKIDIEKIATDVLKEFSPSNLVMPTQLDTISFLQDYLGLEIKRKYIGTFESGILGSIVMCDEMEIPSYDEMFRGTRGRFCCLPSNTQERTQQNRPIVLL